MGQINLLELTPADYPLIEQLLVFANGWMTILIYIRVSTEEQATEHFSLPMQQSQCLDFIKRSFPDTNANVVVVWDDASGMLPFYKPGLKPNRYRHGLTAMVRAIKAGLVQCLVFYRSDRISRSVRVWRDIHDDILVPFGTKFHSCTEPLTSTGTSGGQLLSDILMALNEHNRATIVGNVTDGLRKRVLDGYLVGSPGYGWQMEDRRFVPKGQRVGVRPVPEEAEHVKWMIQMRMGGASYYKIARDSNEKAVPTRTRKNKWVYNTVRSVILNPMHYGFIRNGESGLIEGAHHDHRLFGRDVYDMLKAMDSSETGIVTKRACSHGAIFDRVARCGECNQPLSVIQDTRTTKCYTCRGKDPEEAHRAFRVSAEAVDEKVVECLHEAALDSELLDLAANGIVRLLDEEDGGLEAAERTIISEIHKIGDRIDSWSQKYNEGLGITQEDYESYCSKLHKQRAEENDKLAAVQEKIRQRQSRENRLKLCIRLLRDFPELWKSMDPSEKRTFAMHLIEEMKLHSLEDCILLKLKLVVSECREYRFYRYGNVPEGPEALTLAQLTQIYYLSQGYTEDEIAGIRHISRRTSKMWTRSILDTLNVYDIKKAIRIAAPVVAAKKDRLMLARRQKGFDAAEDFAPGELRILRMKVDKTNAKRRTDAQIASELGVSSRTVRDAVQRIFRKLGVHTIRDAIIEARRRNLISGPHPCSDSPTDLQMDVLRTLSTGVRQRLAAETLGIKLDALKGRIKCMLHKFGLSNTYELLNYAQQKGWID